MPPVTLEEYYRDPGMHRRLDQAAHRERARLMRAGLDWLRERLRPRSQFVPTRWIARLG